MHEVQLKRLKANRRCRSLKDLVKTLSTALPTTCVPLPNDLLLVLHAYLDKHPEFDDAESQKLHEELLTIYQNLVHEKPSRYATFLAVIRTLSPAIRGSGRLMLWWDKLSYPCSARLERRRG